LIKLSFLAKTQKGFEDSIVAKRRNTKVLNFSIFSNVFEQIMKNYIWNNYYKEFVEVEVNKFLIVTSAKFIAVNVGASEFTSYFKAKA